MTAGGVTADKIIEVFGLHGEYSWFVKNNPSNNLPYHNLFHARCMIENCYDGAQYYNLPFDATKLLLTAAIFHDFAHTGGAETDHENIRRAYHHGLRVFFNGDVPRVVWGCVRVTEYPFIHMPMTIEERIIRDADLMQYRYDNWLEMYETNLKKEIEVKMGREVTRDEMYWGNVRFWKTEARYFTDWGKMMHKKDGIALNRHYYLDAEDYE